jgi:serine/threonine protein kinase
MSYDLRCFGWDGCIVPHTLKAVQTFVPKWSDLKILRKKQTENGEDLRLLSTFFHDPTFGPYMPGYTKEKRIDDGSYGNIYLGTRGIYQPKYGKTNGIIHLERDRSMEEVCIKEVRLRITDEERSGSPRTCRTAYEEELRCILAEAFLHALVLKVFETVGNPQRVPKLHEVVGYTRQGHAANSPQDFESVWMIMEMLHGHTLDRYLRTHLKPITSSPTSAKNNETIIIDILLQLAYTLHILQTRIQFNHRDIKLNNLFVRQHTDEWIRDLEIEGYGPYACKEDITLLDFGFSCIGCPVDDSCIINAGSWFEEKDLCFKKDRDLCQFLYALHASYPLDKYVSTKFYDFISAAMIANNNGLAVNLLHGVNADGAPNLVQGRVIFDEGIYTFLKNEGVFVPGCEPFKFLAALRDYERHK